MMRIFSITEVRVDFERLLREVEAGHEVGISRNQKLVARLLPPERKQRIQFPDFGQRARHIWRGATHGTSSDDLLYEARGDR